MPELIMVFTDKDKEILGEALRTRFPFLRDLKAIGIQTGTDHATIMIAFAFRDAEEGPDRPEKQPEPAVKPAPEKPAVRPAPARPMKPSGLSDADVLRALEGGPMSIREIGRHLFGRDIETSTPEYNRLYKILKFNVADQVESAKRREGRALHTIYSLPRKRKPRPGDQAILGILREQGLMSSDRLHERLPDLTRPKLAYSLKRLRESGKVAAEGGLYSVPQQGAKDEPKEPQED